MRDCAFPDLVPSQSGNREAGGVQGRRLCRRRPRSGLPCGPTGASGSSFSLITLGQAPQFEAHACLRRGMQLAGQKMFASILPVLREMHIARCEAVRRGSFVRRRRRYASNTSFFSLFIRPRADSQGRADRRPVHPERPRRLRSVPSATPIRCVWSVNAQGSGLPKGPSIGRETWFTGRGARLTCRQPAGLGPWYPHRTRTLQGAVTDKEPAHHSRVRPWHRDMQREPVPTAP